MNTTSVDGPAATGVFSRRVDGIVIIELSKPDKLNAWDVAMRTRLREMLTEAERDDEVLGVVLTGAGGLAFCAGQDLAESVQWTDSAWVTEMETLFDQIRRFPKPMIAAVNGVAAGSGFQLALLCDIRVGWAGTRLGQTELNHDIPSITGTWLMANEVGMAPTRGLVLRGSVIGGERAYQIGFLDELVATHDDVLTVSLEIARELAAVGADAYATTKEWMRTMTEPGFHHAFEEGRARHGRTFASGHSQAGIRRFLDR